MRLVIGVGNPLRGDDGAGPEVARRVRTAQSRCTTVGSVELLDMWEGADEVIIVDAARSGTQPGTIHCFDARESVLPARTLNTSTHSLGVAQVVELARILGRLPERLRVYGIEVADLTEGSQLSAAVEMAVQELVREIDLA